MVKQPKNLAAYFEEKVKGVPVSLPEIVSSIQTAALGIPIKHVKARILKQKLKIHSSVSSVREQVRSLAAELQCELENVEKLGKYYEAVRMKEQLEGKLQQVNGSIDTLKTTEFEALAKPKLSLMYREERVRYKAEEDRKREETSDFARRLREEQRKRLQKQKAEFEALQRQIEEDKEEETRKTLEKVELLKAEKEERLKSIQEKADQRKEYLRSMRKHAEEVVPPIKQRYAASEPPTSHSPDVAKPSKTISKPKIAKGPTSTETPRRMLPSSPKKYEMSPFLRKALKSEEEERVLKQQESIEKKRRAEKTKRYAEIVKEMFVPVVDMMKQKELELIKHKLNNPVVKRTHADSKSLDQSVAELQPHPLEPSPLTKRLRARRKVEAAKPSESPKKPQVDYLARMHSERKTEVQRLLREDSSEIEGNLGSLSMQSVKDKEEAQGQVRKIERLAHQKERLLRHLDPASIESAKVEAGVNSLMVSSVKAKLALLDHMD